MTVIETDRLVLRPLERGDAEDVARLIGDWDVVRWLTSPPYPYVLEDALWYLDNGGDESRAITIDGSFCGVIGRGKELGYWLGKPFWGQGIMTEAAGAVVGEHFQNSDETLLSGYLLGNERSDNVLTKLGFVETEIRPEMSKPLGTHVQIQKMELSTNRWRQIHEQ